MITTIANLPSFLAIGTKMIAWLFCVSAQGRSARYLPRAGTRFIETPTGRAKSGVEGWTKVLDEVDEAAASFKDSAACHAALLVPRLREVAQ